MIATVFVSDRGDMYLPECRRSLFGSTPMLELLNGPSTVIDDSEHKLGLAGAVRAGFAWALDQGADYVLWIEEDFVFSERVPVEEMASILDRVPRLAQVVLKRQPWSAEEKAAGGQIEVAPDEYEEHSLGAGADYVEHTRLFSLNPSLIRREVLELGWTDSNEAGFTERCLAAGYSFAYYGARHDPPRCEHVGAVRGTGWRL